MTTPKQQNAYPLRMPEQMRDALVERARTNGRSVNAEILVLIEQALSSGGIAQIPTEHLVEELMRRFGPRLQIVLDGAISSTAKTIAPAEKKKKKSGRAS